MAAFSRGKLFSVVWCQVRHRSKINIQKPKPGPWERRVLMEISKPVLPLDEVKPAALCSRRAATRHVSEDSDFEKFLLYQATKMLEENQMIAIMHIPSITAQELRIIRNKFYKEGIRVFRHGNGVMRKVIAGTKWENLSPVLFSHNYYAYSPQTKVRELMAIVKKSPQLNVMCGVVDDAILSKADLDMYSATSLDQQRSHLAGLLSSAVGKTHTLMNSHQQKLSAQLAQYVAQNDDS